ncbi:MAG TPA: carboxypeptidase-like regulatory domain-containing protein, partial [Blastocatellia bacterium]|nr:carboxypeptidase-like regulatory domain-containing protein [Blastocatellia bacterium]
MTGSGKGYVHEAGKKDTPIAGAQVFLVETRSGFQRNTTTDANGNFFLANLKAGIYRIKVQAKNYRDLMDNEPGIDPKEKSEVSGFEVQQGLPSEVQLPPLSLVKIVDPAQPQPVIATQPQSGTPGTPAISQPLSSVANPSTRRLVSLEKTSNVATFDSRTLLTLPLFGNRSFDQLALLAAGVAPAPQSIGSGVGPGVGAGVGTSGQFAVNGLRSRANNFTVDGSDNNDEDIGVRRQGFTALVPQSVESVENFSITTLLPTSQYGRNLGAQVNANSLGGTRQFHGTLYGFYTDRRLKARDAFDQTGARSSLLQGRGGSSAGTGCTLDNAGNVVCSRTIPLANQVANENPFTRGQYGFALSGPVNKRQTLFFTSFERQDRNAVQESHFAVPTVAERGLFGSGETGLLVRTGNQTRQAFPTSAVGDYYFSLFPFANNPNGPYGRNTYTEQLPAGADGAIFSLKLEHPFTAYAKQHLLTGRYNFTQDATTLPVTGEAIYSSLRAKVRTQNISLFLSSTLSPVLSNEARLSYGRTRLNFDEVRSPGLLPSRLNNTPFLLNRPCISNTTQPRDSVTSYDPACITTNTESSTGTLGQVIVSGYSPLGTDVFNFPQNRVNNTFQFADSLTYTRTIHSVQAGVDTRHTQLNSALDRNFRSVAYFGGSLNPASGLSQFLTNVPARNFYLGSDFVAAGAATGFLQTFATTDDSAIGLLYWQNNFFALDQITVKPNFKLTLGLRYEVNTVPRESNRRIESTFNTPEVQGFIAEEKRLFGVSGFERYLGGRTRTFDSDNNNFAPHIAFAWDPLRDGRTVVRGGYGIYYDQIPGAVISQSRSVFPRFLTVNLAGIGNKAQGGRIVTTTNPSQLANSGTLNIYTPNNPNRLGNDFLAFLLNLNSRSELASPNFAAAPGFVLPAADLVTPYSQQWSLAIEREVARNLLVSLAYVGTKGTNLLRFSTPNLGVNNVPVLTDGILRGDQIELIGTINSPGQNGRRPFPLLGAFTSIESDSNSTYHSLQAEASLRLTRGVQFTSAYTWSHAIDEVSDLFALAGSRGLPQSSFKRRLERGDANFDVRHRFAQSFIWDLPFFKQVDLKTQNLLGGWQLAGIVTLQTGQPFTVDSGIDVNLDGNLTDRLNSLSGVRKVNSGSTRFEFPTALDAQRALLAVAEANGAEANGVVGRNTFRAPGIAAFDLAINKNFRFTEFQNLEFRTE